MMLTRTSLQCISESLINFDQKKKRKNYNANHTDKLLGFLVKVSSREVSFLFRFFDFECTKNRTKNNAFI